MWKHWDEHKHRYKMIATEGQNECSARFAIQSNKNFPKIRQEKRYFSFSFPSSSSSVEDFHHSYVFIQIEMWICIWIWIWIRIHSFIIKFLYIICSFIFFVWVKISYRIFITFNLFSLWSVLSCDVQEEMDDKEGARRQI